MIRTSSKNHLNRVFDIDRTAAANKNKALCGSREMANNTIHVAYFFLSFTPCEQTAHRYFFNTKASFSSSICLATVYENTDLCIHV